MDNSYSVFCDASYSEQSKKAAIGVIVLSSDGSVVSHKSNSIHVCNNSFEAEFSAVDFAVRKIPKGSNVTVFSDCSGVVDLINKRDALKKSVRKKYTKFLKSIGKTISLMDNFHIDFLADNSDNMMRVCHILAKEKRKLIEKRKGD